MPQSEGGYKLFKIGDLFDCSGTKSLDEGKLTFVSAGVNFVTRKSDNYGISGRIVQQSFEPNQPNTITSNVVGHKMVRYQEEPYYCSQNINKLVPKFDLNRERAFFIMASIQTFLSSLGKEYDGYKLDELVNHKIQLPIKKNGDIDFDLIETYVRDLVFWRLRELDTYIQTLGFDDYTLTPAEQKAIKESKAYRPLPVGTIFEKPSLSFKKNVFKKKEDISTEKTNEFNLPLVNAKHGQNGIMYYGREQDFDSIEMGIDIVNDGAVSTGDVYPQPQKTGVLYNAYLIRFKDFSPTDSILMFMSAVIEKSIKLKFSYQNKAGWEKVKDCLISVPVSADGSIDYAFMENYINAIKKQTIARVKEYIDSEYKTKEQLLEEPTVEPTITPLRIHDTYQPGRIPLYTLRAACGYFDDGQLPEEEGWIDATGQGFTPDKDRYFAVHAKGDSMLPKIHDGDICVFEWYRAGSRNGEIVLTQSSEYDDAYGGRYTIKRYHSEKIVTDESWQHAKVELQPLNPDFTPIEFDDEGNYRTIGIFKCTLG